MFLRRLQTSSIHFLFRQQPLTRGKGNNYILYSISLYIVYIVYFILCYMVCPIRQVLAEIMIRNI